jgi:hypothetical protein
VVTVQTVKTHFLLVRLQIQIPAAVVVVVETTLQEPALVELEDPV